MSKLSRPRFVTHRPKYCSMYMYASLEDRRMLQETSPLVIMCERVDRKFRKNYAWQSPTPGSLFLLLEPIYIHSLPQFFFLHSSFFLSLSLLLSLSLSLSLYFLPLLSSVTARPFVSLPVLLKHSCLPPYVLPLPHTSLAIGIALPSRPLAHIS